MDWRAFELFFNCSTWRVVYVTIFENFSKLTPKNTTKLGNFPKRYDFSRLA